jgi:Fe2+ transport system protein FeoA
MTLAELHTGDTAVLEDIDREQQMRSRLLEMGLTPGTSVSLLRVAPLGDPLEIKVRGYRLSLRRSDAALIRCRTR